MTFLIHCFLNNHNTAFPVKKKPIYPFTFHRKMFVTSLPPDVILETGAAQLTLLLLLWLASSKAEFCDITNWHVRDPIPPPSDPLLWSDSYVDREEENEMNRKFLGFYVSGIFDLVGSLHFIINLNLTRASLSRPKYEVYFPLGKIQRVAHQGTGNIFHREYPMGFTLVPTLVKKFACSAPFVKYKRYKMANL